MKLRLVRHFAWWAFFASACSARPLSLSESEHDGASHSMYDAGMVVDFAHREDASTPSDLPASDSNAPPPALPRQIAPLSTTSVTQLRPTMRWVLGPGGGNAAVDLCADRACLQPLSIVAIVDGAGTSAQPASDLPFGWVFWRVRVTSGAEIATSATWQFWVKHLGASTAVDTASGTTFDVNGDGHPDLLVGAQGVGNANVLLGDGSGVNFSNIKLTSPTNGMQFGYSVTSAGDVNGDGYCDFLVTDWAFEVANPTPAHLYLGGPQPSASEWNGAGATRRIDLPGVNSLPTSAAAVGDVNGDGYADFLVNRPLLEGGGAELFYGSATPNAMSMTSLGNPQASPDARFGDAIGSAGDVNGDGYADFVVGVPSDSSAFYDAWIYVYLGGPGDGAAAWNSASARRIEVVAPDLTSAFAGAFGGVLSYAGDLNGDGYSDFVAGAGWTSTGGTAYVFLGGASVDGTSWNGAAPSGRIDLTGAFEDFFGWSAGAAGDVDGDGYDDFLVGAAKDEMLTNIGAAYLFRGSATLDASAWTGGSPTAMIAIDSPDGDNGYFSFSLTTAGDLDGDGYADFVIGAIDAQSYAGSVHRYRGETTPLPTDWSGVAPSLRLDITSVDGSGARFGTVQ